MFKLAIRLVWRDWRGGELQLLVMALILSITSLASISLFTARVQQTMVAESATLLAADMRLNGGQVIASQWRKIAVDKGIDQAQISSFQGMLFSDSGMQLASIKAISQGYPLKGTLQVSQQAFGESNEVTQGPKVGELWLDSRLLVSLDAQVGDYVDVGETSLRVTQVLISEPDQASGFAGFAPRAMMHLDDLEATQVVKPGSRIRRSWLLAGDKQTLKKLQEELTPLLTDGQKWQTPDTANSSLADTLERAEQFLLLAGSLTVILAGVALVLSAHRYSLRQANHVAVLKCLGLQPRQLRLLYSVQMVLIFGAALLISLPLTWLLHLVLLSLIAEYFQVIGSVPLFPFILGGITGFLCLLAFVMPAMLDLAKVTPAQALRQSVGHQARPLRYWVIGFVAMLALVFWQSQSLLITLGMVVAVSVLCVSLLLFSHSIMWLAAYNKHFFGQAVKLGIANLQRRQRQNGAQIMIFSLALMLLFSLLGVRNFLIDDWQQRLEEDTPNVFLLNIFGEQRQILNQFVIDQDINVEGLEFYPMTRGRLVDPDPETLIEITEGRPGLHLGREQNLTWGKTLPEDNRLVAGVWWSDKGGSSATTDLEVSVEQGYAERFAWQLGDRLVFNIAGTDYPATISNIREVDWGGLKPNFFLIFSKPLTDEYSTTYLASMYVAEAKRPQLSELLRQHPTISVIDVEQILTQVQKVVGQLSLAVESILLLLLCAGLLVLVASVQASRHERMHESAILRALGASRGLIQKLLLVEYITLGTIAGVLAAAGAETLLAVIQTQLFQLPFTWHWELWVMVPISGALLIGFTGWWFNRSVIQVPPLQILRQLT